jgi:hypothetical protein
MRLICTLMVMMLAGCEIFQEIEKGQTNPPASASVDGSLEEITEQTEEITQATDRVSTELVEIDQSAIGIQNEIAGQGLEGESIDRIETHAVDIRNSVDLAELDQVRVTEALEDLETANVNLAAAVHKIMELEADIAELSETEREIRAESLQNLRNYITLFFVIGFAMLVGGAFLTFWVSGKLGGTIAGIGILTLGLALASQYYLELIAQIGLWVVVGGILVALAVLGWEIYDGSKNKKAMAEIVELIEAMKYYLSPQERQKIFGADGVASRLTDPETKRIIAKIKIKNGFKKKDQVLSEIIPSSRETSDS